MSRIRDPQRLVELVAETMLRESTRADRVHALNGADDDRPAGTRKLAIDDKRGE